MDPVHLTPFPASPVWIGPRAYQVVPVPADDPRLEGHRALTCHEPPTIHVDITRHPREVFELVWHEITHAVDEEFGLNLLAKGRPARIKEEQVATVQGHGWTQVFLDNPALLPWLEQITNYIRSEQEDAE